MNKVFRILALCAALMLALSCCAPSLAEAIDDTAVLVTFDGEGITAAEVKDALANLMKPITPPPLIICCRTAFCRAKSRNWG